MVTPSGTAPGYLAFLGAIIDPNNAIAETNETNNVATWAVKVQQGGEYDGKRRDDR